jgi:cytochrome bd-type quinol oxidase subunit 1
MIKKRKKNVKKKCLFTDVLLYKYSKKFFAKLFSLFYSFYVFVFVKFLMVFVKFLIFFLHLSKKCKKKIKQRTKI